MMRSFGIEYQRWKDVPVKGSVPGQELERMTIWDLDDGRSPGVHGQIHVVMGEANNTLFFKHFTVKASKASI